MKDESDILDLMQQPFSSENGSIHPSSFILHPFLSRFFERLPENPPDAVAASVAELKEFHRQTLRRPELQITIFGAFKAGKSTLLNAMLGYALLPSRTNRATGVITKISYGATPQAELVRRANNGPARTESIYFDDLARFILLDLSDTTAAAPANIEQVNLAIPLPSLQKYTLVDTPGLLDNAELTRISYRQLQQSDLTIMVLSADKLVSQTEREAAQKVHQLTSGNVVFVINRLGLVEADEREDVLNWATTAFKDFGNGLVGQPRIFGTDAKAALEASAKGQPVPASSGLPALQDWMHDLTSHQSDSLIVLARLGVLDSRLANLTEQAQTELGTTRQRIQQAKRDSQTDFENRTRAFNRQVADVRLKLGQLNDHLDGWLEDLAEDVLWRVRTLMEIERDWAEQVQSCFTAPLDKYAERVTQYVRAAMQPVSVRSAAFEVRRPNTPTPGNANPIQNATDWLSNQLGWMLPDPGQVTANVGNWFSSNVLRVNVKGKAYAEVQATVEELKGILRRDALDYVARADQLVQTHAENHPPISTAPAELPNLARHEQYYTALLSWCAECRASAAELRTLALP